MYFNQGGDICTLNGSSLKLVEKFTNLGNSVWSTEKDINTGLAKAWTAKDSLSVMWKSDLTDKIKRIFFFQAAVLSILLYGYITWMLTKRMEKKLGDNYTRMLRVILKKFWRLQPTKEQLYGLPLRKLLKLDEPIMRDTAGKVNTSSWETYYCEPLQSDEQRQDDWQESLYCSSVPIQGVNFKTSRER